MAAVFDPAVASYLSQAGGLEKRVLGNVAAQTAISGWALSKNLNRNPDDVLPVLQRLRKKNRLDVNGDGLEGIYFLTKIRVAFQRLFQEYRSGRPAR